MSINRANSNRSSNSTTPATSSYYNRLGHTTNSSSQNGSANSIGLSNIKSKSTMAKMASFLAGKSWNECEFCKNAKQLSCNHFYVKSMVKRQLYVKYASSQNYYYTRDINEILANGRTQVTIYFQDVNLFDQQEEYLKRHYKCSQFNNKIQLLSEYYQFHQDIPRIFILPQVHVLNNYHDKQRRIEYFQIAKIIQEENQQNPNRPPQGIVGDKPNTKNSSDYDPESTKAPQEKGLVGVMLLGEISSFINRGTDDGQTQLNHKNGQHSVYNNINNQKGGVPDNQSQATISNHSKRSNHIQNNLNSNNNNNNNINRNGAGAGAEQNDHSVTLQEINMKLNEITKSSQFVPDFDFTSDDQNNLNSFINYMKRTSPMLKDESFVISLSNSHIMLQQQMTQTGYTPKPQIMGIEKLNSKNTNNISSNQNLIINLQTNDINLNDKQSSTTGGVSGAAKISHDFTKQNTNSIHDFQSMNSPNNANNNNNHITSNTNNLNYNYNTSSTTTNHNNNYQHNNGIQSNFNALNGPSQSENFNSTKNSQIGVSSLQSNFPLGSNGTSSSNLNFNANNGINSNINQNGNKFSNHQPPYTTGSQQNNYSSEPQGSSNAFQKPSNNGIMSSNTSPNHGYENYGPSHSRNPSNATSNNNQLIMIEDFSEQPIKVNPATTTNSQDSSSQFAFPSSTPSSSNDSATASLTERIQNSQDYLIKQENLIGRKIGSNNPSDIQNVVLTSGNSQTPRMTTIPSSSYSPRLFTDKNTIVGSNSNNNQAGSNQNSGSSRNLMNNQDASNTIKTSRPSLNTLHQTNNLNQVTQPDFPQSKQTINDYINYYTNSNSTSNGMMIGSKLYSKETNNISTPRDSVGGQYRPKTSVGNSATSSLGGTGFSDQNIHIKIEENSKPIGLGNSNSHFRQDTNNHNNHNNIGNGNMGSFSQRGISSGNNNQFPNNDQINGFGVNGGSSSNNSSTQTTPQHSLYTPFGNSPVSTVTNQHYPLGQDLPQSESAYQLKASGGAAATIKDLMISTSISNNQELNEVNSSQKGSILNTNPSFVSNSSKVVQNSGNNPISSNQNQTPSSSSSNALSANSKLTNVSPRGAPTLNSLSNNTNAVTSPQGTQRKSVHFNEMGSPSVNTGLNTHQYTGVSGGGGIGVASNINNIKNSGHKYTRSENLSNGLNTNKMSFENTHNSSKNSNGGADNYTQQSSTILLNNKEGSPNHRRLVVSNSSQVNPPVNNNFFPSNSNITPKSTTNNNQYTLENLMTNSALTSKNQLNSPTSGPMVYGNSAFKNEPQQETNPLSSRTPTTTSITNNTLSSQRLGLQNGHSQTNSGNYIQPSLLSSGLNQQFSTSSNNNFLQQKKLSHNLLLNQNEYKNY